MGETPKATSEIASPEADTVPQALAAIGRGQMAILYDDQGSDGGVLCLAADCVTPSSINFMATHARGLICLPLEASRLQQLEIPLMVDPAENESVRNTAFGVSIEARVGVTTGISAYDRAQTIRAAVADGARPDDLARPGHVFPILAADWGVLANAAPPEASVDLARLAGRRPGAVICQIINEHGRLASRDDLERFAFCHDLPLVSIADLVRHRFATESVLRRSRDEALQTAFGEFRSVLFASEIDGTELVTLVRGEVQSQATVRVRIHRECTAGDLFASEDCECGSRLRLSLQSLGEDQAGILVYLRDGAGRGPGAAMSKTTGNRAASESESCSSVLGEPDADPRLELVADALRQLGVRRLCLESARAGEEAQMAACGFEVAPREFSWDSRESTRTPLRDPPRLRDPISV